MRNKLKEFRLRKLMSQEELAEKSGISRATISMLENRPSRNTSTNTLIALARALEVPVEQVFFADSD